MRHYCTHFDWNYIKQGLALHASMEQHCQPYHLWILALCDKTWDFLSHAALPNVTVVALDSVETARLAGARTDRSWREYIWTLTSWWMLWCLKKQQLESVSYIDADCFFFSPLEPVFDRARYMPLAITPHRFAEQHKCFEVNGLYNVGLVYAKQQGLDCIEAWAELCLQWCKGTAEGGKFGDQKYWDALVPKYHVHVIRHEGVNLAPWNQAQYNYIIYNDHLYVNEQRLIMYHFHQGVVPRWELHPIVREKVYPAYVKALGEVVC